MNRLLSTMVLSTCLGPLACGGRTPMAVIDDAGTPLDTNVDVTPGATDAPCTAGGPVTFHLRADPGTPSSFCIGKGCSLEWLSLSNDRGEAVLHEPPCLPRCEGCGGGGCDLLCRLPQMMKANGEFLTWDGRLWTTSSCSGASCTRPTCAPPGKYVAMMCAHLAAGGLADGGRSCDPNTTSQVFCSEVTFEYPTSAVVEGVLP